MNRTLVVPRHRSGTMSRRALARSEAERLRNEAARAANGTLVIHADRLREIADLLDSLAHRERSEALPMSSPSARDPIEQWQPANSVEQDLAALMMRSLRRGDG